jgi:hypothetical protein
MTQQLILTLILLILSACDAPRSTRSFYRENGAERQSFSSSDDGYNFPSSELEMTIPVPPEAQHCTFSPNGIDGYSNFSTHLSSRYNICQSQTNDAKVFFQIKNPIYDNRVCFLPTYNAPGSSTSIYLGSPKCLFLESSNNIYTITLTKDRLSPYGATSYSQYPINGVMVIQDKSYYFPAPFNVDMSAVDAYLRCNQMLDQGVTSYCQAFKAAGEYTYSVFNN